MDNYSIGVSPFIGHPSTSSDTAIPPNDTIEILHTDSNVHIDNPPPWAGSVRNEWIPRGHGSRCPYAGQGMSF